MKVTFVSYAAITCMSQVVVLYFEPHEIIANGLRLGSFFLAGVLIYLWGDRLPLSVAHFALVALVFLGLVLLGLAEAWGQLPLAYCVLWLGGKVPTRIGSRNDISYGLYIWAFPIQQSLAVLAPAWLGPWGSAGIALALTLPIAWLSWVVVERPAMGLRRPLTAHWRRARARCMRTTERGPAGTARAERG